MLGHSMTPSHLAPFRSWFRQPLWSLVVLSRLEHVNKSWNALELLGRSAFQLLDCLMWLATMARVAAKLMTHGSLQMLMPRRGENRKSLETHLVSGASPGLRSISRPSELRPHGHDTTGLLIAIFDSSQAPFHCFTEL